MRKSTIAPLASSWFVLARGAAEYIPPDITTLVPIALIPLTKSIWPCVILHTIEASLINLLILSGYINVAVGKEILISPINGVITSLLYLAVGMGIRAYRKHADQNISIAV